MLDRPEKGSRNHFSSRRAGWLLSALACALAASFAHAGTTIFVDDDAPARGNGADWPTAFAHLQDALTFAGDPANNVTQIRLAQGIYRPDRSESNPAGSGDRESTFRLISGVTILGGYLGLSANPEQDPNQRSIESNLTILSGDFAGDDLPPDPKNPTEFPNSAENAYQVVTAIDVDATAILDGVIITGGHADGAATIPESSSRDRGSAVNIHAASPTLSNCTVASNWSASHGAVNDQGAGASIVTCQFIANYANDFGGGLAVHWQSATTVIGCAFSQNSAFRDGGAIHCRGLPTASFTGCTFTGNSANHGGGVFNDGNSVTFSDCSFSQNTASQGAGMFNELSTALIDHCTFSENSVISGGGGIWNNSGAPLLVQCSFTSNYADGGGAGVWDEESSPSIFNCSFIDNTAFGPGCGLYNAGGAPTVTNCTFTGNIAYAGGGGGMWNGTSNPVITNCSFTANQADTGGGIYNSHQSLSVVNNCIFTANSASEGAGMYSLESNITADDCVFVDNVVWGGSFPVGGGLSNYFSSSVIRNCSFIHNSAELGGGGAYNEGEAPTLISCSFQRNVSTAPIGGWGGGVLNAYFCSPKIINCTFSGNLANFGGGVFNLTFSSPQIINCSISGNAALAAEGAGGVYNYSEQSAPMVRNCIVWNNTAPQIGGALIDVARTCVQSGYPGQDNIDSDPLFTTDSHPGADGVWSTPDDNLGDFHLLTASPCIDAGDNQAFPPPTTTDFDGQPRVVDAPATPNTGSPPAAEAHIDLGAFEFQPRSCPADIAGSQASPDGVVNVHDLLAVISAWGPCAPEPASCPADLAPGSGNGAVDVNDLLVVISTWGPCP
ncbi:MAG: right-handed parallel beta-helix repeat-containing protein [Phycisphaerales bacterium]|nr:right-handed parallel beta-helix repeat-containing protein [Phycisphaerales bacterium]